MASGDVVEGLRAALAAHEPAKAGSVARLVEAAQAVVDEHDSGRSDIAAKSFRADVTPEDPLVRPYGVDRLGTAPGRP